jgi:hypothetical protein
MMLTCYPDSTNWGSKDWTGATPEQLVEKELAEAFAWRALDILTAGAIATCPISLRPARTHRYGRYYLSPADGATGLFHPYIGVDGLWRNDFASDWDWDDCWNWESRESRIVLPGPVSRIVSVEIDGVAMNPIDYRVDNSAILVRMDGKAWPLNQDMRASAGEKNTFVVTYFKGSAPDNMVDYAAGVLAKEFLLSVQQDKKCRLPSRVTAVTRQGVSYTLDLTMFENGATGITEVDMIVSTYNPYKLKTASKVYSVDDARHRVTTSGYGAVGSSFSTGAPTSVAADPVNAGYYVDTIYTTGN